MVDQGLLYKRRLSFWKRLIRSNNQLTTKIRTISEENNKYKIFKNWHTTTQEWAEKATNKIGEQAKERIIHTNKKSLKDLIHKKEEQDWKKRMGDKHNLEIYRSLKNKLQMEDYLKGWSFFPGRELITQLRSGKLNLGTPAKNKFKKWNTEDRCILCKSEMEGLHVLTSCPETRKWRNHLHKETGQDALTYLGKRQYTQLTTKDKNNKNFITLGRTLKRIQREIQKEDPTYLLSLN